MDSMIWKQRIHPGHFGSLFPEPMVREEALVLAKVFNPDHIGGKESLLYHEGRRITLGIHAFGGVPISTPLARSP